MKYIAVTAWLVATPVFAQDKTAEIDKIFAWTKPNEPGCSIAASLNGKEVVNRAYGSADIERDVPIKAETLFDVGSIRKQFVAASIFLLEQEGKLSVSDDVRKHIPEMPDYGTKITLEHLLTHTSGIRDWVALLNFADGDIDAWTMILRQRGLNFTPGDELSYSNSGFVLLPEVVARVSGMSFPEFLRNRILEPLGMKSTMYVNDMKDIIKNRALAYEKEGGKGWKHDMLLGNDRGGAGGLFSTPGDLLIWNDALTNKRLGASVTEKLEEPAKLNNGRTISTFAHGLFLQSYRGAKEIWYSGSSAAYKGWIGRYPEQGLAIAILCNSGDSSDRTAFAHRVFDLFVPGAPAAAPDTETGPPPTLTGDALADVNAKAGLFFEEKTLEPLRLTVDRGRFRVAGGPGLVPVAKDRYRRFGVTAQYMSEDKFEVSFASPDVLEMKSMEGKITRYRRGQAYTPTDADVKSFAGRYESNDLKAVIHIWPGKTGGLMGRLNDTKGDGFEFKPVDRDTFQLGMLTVRFMRDKASKVIGIDVNNPVFRGVKFTRMGDVIARP